jgi:hypothetical protein
MENSHTERMLAEYKSKNYGPEMSVDAKTRPVVRFNKF